MPKVIKEENNSNRCQQCQCQLVWGCPCQRMLPECNSSHNHSWASRFHKAFRVRSVCHYCQGKWDKCLWCQGCRVCLQCSHLLVGWWCHQTSFLTKVCRSYLVNNSLTVVWIRTNNHIHRKCHRHKISQKRKNHNQKVGAMSWQVRRRKVRKLFRNRKKRLKWNNSSSGRMMKDMAASKWIWTIFHKE